MGGLDPWLILILILILYYTSWYEPVVVTSQGIKKKGSGSKVKQTRSRLSPFLMEKAVWAHVLDAMLIQITKSRWLSLMISLTRSKLMSQVTSNISAVSLLGTTPR